MRERRSDHRQRLGIHTGNVARLGWPLACPGAPRRRAGIVGRKAAADMAHARQCWAGGEAMTGRPDQSRPRPRQLPMFATCAPGIGRLLRRQLAAVDGIDVTGSGFDGQTDIVFFDTDRPGRAHALRSRLAEDVFAEIGRASRGRGVSRATAGAVASKAWRLDTVERALSVFAEEVRQLSGSMTYRVTARVRTQVPLRRPDLRRAMAAVIDADKPRWKFADPAQLEFRLSEWHDGQYVAGLQISRVSPPRTERPAGQSGLLPATVAAAMVQLAGDEAAAPTGARGRVLLDPCCGAGAILAEAAAAGWEAQGSDIDPIAVEMASQIATGLSVQLGDARELLMADDYVDACVSWLPGRGPDSWPLFAGEVLSEMSRVTHSGGHAVLLAPELPRAVTPGALRLRKQIPVQLPGAILSIWVFHRA
jgi:SAM-dependent methyltransferase